MLSLVVGKKLPPTALQHPNSAGQQFNEWLLKLPPGHELEDVFGPQYWAHCTAKLRTHDLIRIMGADGSFDVTVTVREKSVGGVRVELWPKFRTGFDAQARAEAEAAVAAAAAAISVVPIMPNGKAAVRIDYTEATKWRVIALDGSNLVSDLDSEAKATEAMEKYLASLRMRLPTEAEFAIEAERRAKIVAEKEAADAKRKAARAR